MILYCEQQDKYLKLEEQKIKEGTVGSSLHMTVCQCRVSRMYVYYIYHIIPPSKVHIDYNLPHIFCQEKLLNIM